MKKHVISILSLAFGLCACAEIRHEFVCVDNLYSQLLHVDQFSGTSWAVPLPQGSRDLFLLDDQRVLVSHPDGAEIYRLKDGASLRRFEGFADVSSASRTPRGTFLLGSLSGFHELDESGNKLRTIVPESPLVHLRLVRMLENGNILCCAGYDIHEIDPSGKVLWSHRSAGKTYLALDQGDGSCLSTKGGLVELVRVRRDGSETVVCGGSGSHPDASLAWFSGFYPLPNGHVVVANWRGHGYDKPSRHLFEFNAANEIVWSWDDPNVKAVTMVQVIR